VHIAGPLKSNMSFTQAGNPDSVRVEIHQMLSNYVSNAQCDTYLNRLNDTLNESSSYASDDYSDINNYYLARPGLRSFTLNEELNRCDYSLILEHGEKVTKKLDISEFINSQEVFGHHDSPISTQELLVRAANQSLLADAIANLSGKEEELKRNPAEVCSAACVFQGPMLSMQLAVEKCHYTINLQSDSLEVCCVLAISVPVGSERLVLARGTLLAHYCPRNQRPLSYNMQLVKTYHSLGPFTLSEAADSLAKDQEILACQKEMGNDVAETSWSFDFVPIIYETIQVTNKYNTAFQVGDLLWLKDKAATIMEDAAHYEFKIW